MIDEIFQQEMRNGDLKKRYWIRFLLNDVIKCCFKKSKCFIPTEYNRNHGNA